MAIQVRPIWACFSGHPEAASGTVEFYIAGTTTAKQYYDKDGTAQGTSAALTANGNVSNGAFGVGAYKLVFKDSDGAAISGLTLDNIQVGMGIADGLVYDIADIHNGYTGTAISSAITAVGSDDITLLMKRNPDGSDWSITQNLTFNSNTVLRAANGATFDGNSGGYTLDITKLEAGDYQIFKGYAINDIKIRRGTSVILASWFGAKSDGGVTENGAIISQAISASYLGCKHVKLTDNYEGTTTINIPSSTPDAPTLNDGVTLSGVGWRSSSYTINADTYALTIGDQTTNQVARCIIQDLGIYGQGGTAAVAAATPSQALVFIGNGQKIQLKNCYMTSAVYGVYIYKNTVSDQIELHNCRISGIYKKALYNNDGDSLYLYDVKIQGSGGGGYTAGPSPTAEGVIDLQSVGLSWFGGDVSGNRNLEGVAGNYLYAMRVQTSKRVHLSGVHFETNCKDLSGSYDLRLQNCYGGSIVGCTFYGNNAEAAESAINIQNSNAVAIISPSFIMGSTKAYDYGIVAGGTETKGLCIINPNDYDDTGFGTSMLSFGGTSYTLLQDGALSGNFITFTSTDATPSVRYSNRFITAGTTAITDFDDAYEGQEIFIYATDNITITHNSAKIDLNGAADYNMTNTDTLTLVSKGGIWTEKCRSVN